MVYFWNMKALMLSTAVAKLSTKDVKMAFQETKNGISRYILEQGLIPRI